MSYARFALPHRRLQSTTQQANSSGLVRSTFAGRVISGAISNPGGLISGEHYRRAVWAVGFMSDSLYGGCRFRTLNVLDEGLREGLAIEIDTSLPTERVIRAGTAAGHSVRQWTGNSSRSAL